MYRSGYDFQHFLGSSVPVLVIEAIVRIAYFAHGLSHGSDLTAAVPLASDPKLRTQLLIAHSVAATVSAGKVCITRNPMTVSWSQWLGFFRYLVPQLRWLLIERANQRARHVDVALERQWEEIDKGHTELWKRLFGAD